MVATRWIGAEYFPARGISMMDEHTTIERLTRGAGLILFATTMGCCASPDPKEDPAWLEHQEHLGMKIATEADLDLIRACEHCREFHPFLRAKKR